MKKRKSNKLRKQKPVLPTSSKADARFSKWIRERDPKCFFGCGRPSIQNSHFWGRGASSTRYDPENCDGVCGGCHMRHEGSKQGEYRDRKIAQLGMEAYAILEKRARTYMSRSDAIAGMVRLIEGEGPIQYGRIFEK
jgi:hypothetical protein